MAGVISCVIGYPGGEKKNPTYQNIMDSTEAFMIEFDPNIISYEEILDEWSDQHAPYYPSKCQYKSGVWYTSDEQRIAAEKKVEELSKGGQRKVYVDIEPVKAFYEGEEYHQNFLDKQVSSRAPMW